MSKGRFTTIKTERFDSKFYSYFTKLGPQIGGTSSVLLMVITNRKVYVKIIKNQHL
jgi:hypothetical protein